MSGFVAADVREDGFENLIAFHLSAINQAILSSFGLVPKSYSLTKLRYDLRKMKAHRLLERDGRRYPYRLTDKGTRAPLLLHQRVCGPLANGLFPTAQLNRARLCPKSKPRTAKPTTPSTKSSNC